jgi:dihydroxyacetone kinase-like predicted kinase
MEKARKAVHTVEVTRAIRTTKIGDMRIRKNQAIGLLDTDLVAVANTAEDVLGKVLDDLDMDEAEVVTIYYGQDVDRPRPTRLPPIYRNNIRTYRWK